VAFFKFQGSKFPGVGGSRERAGAEGRDRRSGGGIPVRYGLITRAGDSPKMTCSWPCGTRLTVPLGPPVKCESVWLIFLLRCVYFMSRAAFAGGGERYTALVSIKWIPRDGLVGARVSGFDGTRSLRVRRLSRVGLKALCPGFRKNATVSFPARANRPLAADLV
jgi:hypothetical protein